MAWRTQAAPRALGLTLGYLADLLWADPRRGHPVAVFGTAATALERVSYRPHRVAGAVHEAALVGSVVTVGALAERWSRCRPVTRTLLTACCTWVVLGGTSLAREGAAMAELLADDDLAGARRRLSHLCSRTADDLGADDLARAATESLGENTSDAVVAPLWWGALLGVPGLLGYRAANTMDAMVGYRNDRYQEFGWAAARFDDLLNLVPARLAAVLTTGIAAATGGDARECLRAWREDAPHHPSPNAGPVEATFAGALGVRLGGANSYDGQVEDRGTLGRGRPVRRTDLARAVTLSRAIGAAAVATTTALAATVDGIRAGVAQPAPTGKGLT